MTTPLPPFTEDELFEKPIAQRCIEYIQDAIAHPEEYGEIGLACAAELAQRLLEYYDMLLEE